MSNTLEPTQESTQESTQDSIEESMQEPPEDPVVTEEPSAGPETAALPETPQPLRARTRGRTVMKRLALGLAVVLLLANTAGVGYLLQRQQEDGTRIRELKTELASAGTTIDELEAGLDGARQVATRAYAAADALKAKSVDTNAVVEEVRRSVVTVQCGDSLGSGFAITAPLVGKYETAIITNHHVIEECTFTGGPKASVSRGGKTHTTRLWSWDPDNDLALLFIMGELKRLVAAPEPAVGDPVLAIGSPYGLEGSVTTGIISRIEKDWYQTSALINPGNSGGPLLDKEGRVLGINTLSVGGGGSGIGAAIRLRVSCEDIFSEYCEFAN